MKIYKNYDRNIFAVTLKREVVIFLSCGVFTRMIKGMVIFIKLLQADTRFSW